MGDEPFWSVSLDDLLRQLHTSRDGLSSEAARERYIAGAKSRLKPHHDISVVFLLLSQFRSPIILGPYSSASSFPAVFGNHPDWVRADG